MCVREYSGAPCKGNYATSPLLSPPLTSWEWGGRCKIWPPVGLKAHVAVFSLLVRPRKASDFYAVVEGAL